MVSLQGHGKKAVKYIVRRLSPSAGLPAIICASPGRSGSTLLFEAIGDAIARKRAPLFHRHARRTFRDAAWELDRCQLREGVVYKTHDLPTSLRKTENLRAVFIYGPPSEALLSVLDCERRLGREWVAEHLRHLRMPQATDLMSRDAIGFENQMRLWSQEERFPVLCVNYEKLWDNIGKIGSFLNLDVDLPERRERRDKAIYGDRAIKADLIYKNIKHKFDDLPEVFLSKNGMWSR
jgi:hypothetical protein